MAVVPVAPAQDAAEKSAGMSVGEPSCMSPNPEMLTFCKGNGILRKPHGWPMKLPWHMKTVQGCQPCTVQTHTSHL